MARHKSRRNYNPGRRASLPQNARDTYRNKHGLQPPLDRALELIRAGFKEVKGWNVRTRPDPWDGWGARDRRMAFREIVARQQAGRNMEVWS